MRCVYKYIHIYVNTCAQICTYVYVKTYACTYTQQTLAFSFKVCTLVAHVLQSVLQTTSTGLKSFIRQMRCLLLLCILEQELAPNFHNTCRGSIQFGTYFSSWLCALYSLTQLPTSLSDGASCGPHSSRRVTQPSTGSCSRCRQYMCLCQVEDTVKKSNSTGPIKVAMVGPEPPQEPIRQMPGGTLQDSLLRRRHTTHLTTVPHMSQ